MDPLNILFGGGGTGGHIFPNIAVLEHLREKNPQVTGHFVVSERPNDARTLTGCGLAFTAIPARPLSIRPWHWLALVKGWRQSIDGLLEQIQRQPVHAAIVTGGFVSAPVVRAIRRLNVPMAMVNLDAVPGKANRLLARQVDHVFTAYPLTRWPRAQTIGFPLRKAALGCLDPKQAREKLGLDPRKNTLVVTGASSGAESINQLMLALVNHTRTRHALARWQVLHLAGRRDLSELEQAYQQAGVPAKVMDFLDEMGLAWASATVAISRAGAGSVAEVWANAVPTLFLPYPYHRDEHQRFNAAPLAASGACKLYRDLVDPRANMRELAGPLVSLMANDTMRQGMQRTLKETCPPNGAAAVADWIRQVTS